MGGGACFTPLVVEEEEKERNDRILDRTVRLTVPGICFIDLAYVRYTSYFSPLLYTNMP